MAHKQQNCNFPWAYHNPKVIGQTRARNPRTTDPIREGWNWGAGPPEKSTERRNGMDKTVPKIFIRYIGNSNQILSVKCQFGGGLKNVSGNKISDIRKILRKNYGAR